MAITIGELKALIQETHQHGLKLDGEIHALEGKHSPVAKVELRVLRDRLKGLESLNARRRAELAKLEHQKPQPKPAPPAPKPTPKLAPKPPAQRFTMYDSTNASNIPHDPEAVAGYADGAFANFDEMVRDFPRAKHLSIAVSSATDAGALDVENGDATPADAPGWVRRQHARGLKRPVVYANASTMPAVISALEHDDIKREEFLLWVADYDGVADVPPGFDAKQWRDHDELYDESICESWFL